MFYEVIFDKDGELFPITQVIGNCVSQLKMRFSDLGLNSVSLHTYCYR